MKKEELDLNHPDALKFNIFMSNGQLGLITSQSADKSIKTIFAVGWVGPISFAPFLLYASIGNGKTKDDIMAYRYSYSIIKSTGVFGFNIPTIEMLDIVKKIGTTHSDEVDKFQDNDLTVFRGKQTKVPLIEECFINVECEIINKMETGDHDIFIAKPVSLTYNEDVFTDGRFSDNYKDKKNQIHIIDALPEYV